MLCADSSVPVDVHSVLLELKEGLSRQEAMTDMLLKKMYSLEEKIDNLEDTGNQCLSFVSRITRQMSGLSKQLKLLSQQQYVAGLAGKNTEASTASGSGEHRSNRPAGHSTEDLGASDGGANLNGTSAHLSLAAQSRVDGVSNSIAALRNNSGPVVVTSQARADIASTTLVHRDSGELESPLVGHPEYIGQGAQDSHVSDMEGSFRLSDMSEPVAENQGHVQALNRVKPNSLPIQVPGDVMVSSPVQGLNDNAESSPIQGTGDDSPLELSTPFYRHTGLLDTPTGLIDAPLMPKLPTLEPITERPATTMSSSEGATLPHSQPPYLTQPPQARPISLQYYSSKPLPSSVIDKSSLGSVKHTLSKYKHAKPHYLAGKLACEAVFGKDVLRLCTPLGCSSYPALPQAELYMIKQLVLNTNPHYWDKLDEFESMWRNDIIRRITYTCSRFRREHNRKGGVQEIPEGGPGVPLGPGAP